MKRPLVIEEERINFTEKEEICPEDGILLMSASMENGEQR